MSLSRIATAAVVLSMCQFLALPAFGQRARAVLGRPYGVAHVSIPLPPNADPSFLASRGFSIDGPPNRVLYPAFGTGRLKQIAAEFLGADVIPGANQLDVSFLFTGVEPFEITVYTPEPVRVPISPMGRRGRIHQVSMKHWWRDYHAQLRAQESAGDYPPLVETYLSEMLSQRLGMESPLPSRMREETRSDLQQLTDLLFGAEDLRLATIRDTMRGRIALNEPADIPVPEEFDWQPHEFALPANTVEIEPIALHVPEECFYIRFGNFKNYLWLDHLKDDYGGNLGQMITLRGHDARLDEKQQYQLALRQSAVSEFFGPRVISDVAMIGRDMYLREGAALGMLFEANNSEGLRANLERDREKSLNEERENGATLETVTIEGRDVSFLSTPDNRIRSYYAVDGDYHLVTTSRSIVERFLQAGGGKGSLGASPEFQYARTVMPLTRDDTVFAYFSTAFFGGLMSPQYQVALSRRMQRVANDDLLQLATLAATAEGMPHESVEDLIDGQFLPRSFPREFVQVGNGSGDSAVAADGAQTTPVIPAKPVPLSSGDSRPPLAGKAEGFLPPIPDVPITAITRSEAARLERAAGFFNSKWPQMDPLMVGVQRTALEGERMERVVIDGNVSPIVEEKYGWLLSLVGPPTDVEIQSNPADVITMQLSLQGGTRWPNVAAHQMFLGVQDLSVGSEFIPSGGMKLLRLLRSTPGYLGAWPGLGLLDRLPITPPPDVAGFSQLPLGLWRWQGGGFSVLSFYRDVLADASAHLQPVPTDNPAQIRLRVGDLSNSQLAGWVTSLNYSRAYQASVGNAQLLNTLSQQFRIPKEQSLITANSLLDTELVCTLGGTYAVSADQRAACWQSTAWPSGNNLPDDYQSRLLEWFRGASADFTKAGDELILHAEIDMQRMEREPAFGLPLLNKLRGSQPKKN